MSEIKRSTIFSGKVASPLRLADTVSDAIAAALLEGSIAPGEALPPEGEIAKEFGVSRPIAREALRQLTSAGLVTTQQGKVARAKALSGEPMDKIYGYAVRSSIKSLKEANEMRRVMETGIAKLAASRRDADGLALMRKALADMHSSLGNPQEFTEADIRFHLGMAMTTGNSMIRIQIEGLRSIQTQVSEIFSTRSTRSMDDWRRTVARHQDIFKAIEAGDPQAAEDRILAHYEAADVASVEVAEDSRGGNP
ncbi:FadR family transcriptional regulator [Aureimonas fodinaquatilis]|uniref:FadR family transcriptional regulator n=1 Tax=Aureimonas fodinaquatilis TaxID=2565783 RepID=A0A5B0DRF3_9HYPH|nr:FCD domain-containing protein [Aureimonas fodinaquatilis]KAA0969374.1 FadR family transcriptional regulator [Aureimonas fodinaquatilis]